MTLGIYIRVSSEGQQKKEESLPYQKQQGERFAEERGWTPKIYVDVQTGKDPKRKAFKDLKEDISRGLIDAVWVLNHYRLARNALTALEFVELLEKRFPIPFFLDNREYDYNDPRDKQIFTMWAADAEAEGVRIRARTMRGRDHKFLNGGMHARRLYGYYREYNKNGKVDYKKHPDEEKILKEIVQRIINGDSYRKIATDLTSRRVPGPESDTWSSGTISRLANQKMYAGFYDYKGVENIESYYYEPILTWNEWLKLQSIAKEAIKRKSTPLDMNYNYHIGTGIVKCWHCEGKLFHCSDKTNHPSGLYEYRNYKVVHKKGCNRTKYQQAIDAEDFDIWLTLQTMEFLMAKKTMWDLYEGRRREFARKNTNFQEQIENFDKEIRRIIKRKKELLSLNFLSKSGDEYIDKEVKETLQKLSLQQNELENERKDIEIMIASEDSELEKLLKELTQNSVYDFLLCEPFEKREKIKEYLSEGYIKDDLLVLTWITGKTVKLPEYRKYFKSEKWQQKKAQKKEFQDIVGEFDDLDKAIDAVEGVSNNLINRVVDKHLDNLQN